MKAVEYKTVSEQNPEALDLEVNRMLGMGYALWGPQYVNPWTGCACQVMILDKAARRKNAISAAAARSRKARDTR